MFNWDYFSQTIISSFLFVTCFDFQAGVADSKTCIAPVVSKFQIGCCYTVSNCNTADNCNTVSNWMLLHC